MGRVRNVVNRANARLPLKTAAALLGGSTLLASLLGLFRDRLLNSTYATTYPVGLDAYTVAFTIPDFMFFLLTSGALSVTFIPVFNERIAKGNKKSAWALSYSMINFMALVTLVASLLIIIFADVLISLIWPGLNEQGHGLAASMMRIIAVNPFLFAVASVIASMQQAVGRFIFFSLAPLIYNIGIIIGIVFFTNGITIFGFELFEGGIMGVALGVVLGSILQLIVGTIGLIGMGFDYRFKIAWRNKGFRQTLGLLPARSLDQGIDYVNTIVETSLASRLAVGAIRNYQQAVTLHTVPINLIGVAISTAAFPQMTERLGLGQVDLFRQELQSVLRVIIWLALPVAVVTYFGRGYLASFLFNGGNPEVATALGVLSIAIIFRSIYHIASRSFYAQKDTKTPLYISLFTIALNIGLATWFTLGLGLGIFGLAWAQVITAVTEVAILFTVMSTRIPNLFDESFVGSVGRMLMAAVPTGFVSWISVKVFDFTIQDQSFFATFPKFSLIALVSLAAFVGLTYALRLSEAQKVIRWINKGLFFQAKGQN